MIMIIQNIIKHCLKNVIFESDLNNSYSLAEKKQISEDTMSLIQNSDDYPQYEGAQKINQQLIADANWKFTDKINSDYPSYNYQYNNLKNLLQTRANFLNQSYNNCQYPQKSLKYEDIVVSLYHHVLVIHFTILPLMNVIKHIKWHKNINMVQIN